MTVVICDGLGRLGPSRTCTISVGPFASSTAVPSASGVSDQSNPNGPSMPPAYLKSARAPSKGVAKVRTISVSPVSTAI